MTFQVRTIVFDPGEAAPPPDVNWGAAGPPKDLDKRCLHMDGHQWQPVVIDGSGSTWFCPHCRRVERRYLEQGAQ